MQKIGLGGSCHWCTEAIFQSLRGIGQVLQGWISSYEPHTAFSEAIVVEYDESIIALERLIEIHLHTHSCTSVHSLRSKYRSAIYVMNERQAAHATSILASLQQDFQEPIITMVLAFREFKLNKRQYLNYYYSNPKKPFCENIISPKLKYLMTRFGDQVDR